MEAAERVLNQRAAKAAGEGGGPQRQVGGILGAKYETGLRLKGASFRVKWVKPDLVGTI